MKMKIIAEFIIGLVFSIIGFMAFGAVYDFVCFRLRIDLPFGLTGGSTGIIGGLSLAIPIGALLGISVVNKLIYKSSSWNLMGIITGFILSFAGAFVSLWLFKGMVAWGSLSFFLTSMILTCLCITGYNLVRLVVPTKNSIRC